MKLETEFIRLPLRIEAERLAGEIAQLPESAWRPHPQGFTGNSAIPLVAVDGDPASDALAGPMRATPILASCPYLLQVLDSLKAVIGRTRLMRLDGNAEARRHADIAYYWFDRVRVHVPVVTHPDVTFHCGARDRHMAAGEVWIFDTWSSHAVSNPRSDQRIHLVADTVGSAAFWSMVEGGDRVFASDRTPPDPDREVAFERCATPELLLESWNRPDIMPAAQLGAIVDQIRSALPSDDPRAESFSRTLVALQREWVGAWARFGRSNDGLDEYASLRRRFGTELEALGTGLILRNGTDAATVARELLVGPALEQRSRPRSAGRTETKRAGSAPSASAKREQPFDRPIFIVCPPRSGSSLLLETLAQSPDVCTIGGESHRTIEGIRELHPASREFASNRLTAADAIRPVVSRLQDALWRELRDRDQQPRTDRTGVRLLEKTPKNSLRVPFLAAAFPDAYFIYLYRDPRETLSSMLDAWRSGKFVTYPDLPGWEGLRWSLLLTQNWRELIGRPLSEIVAHQWTSATDQLLDDLEALPPDSWCVASYDQLLSNPQSEIERICRFVEVDWDRTLDAPLPLSRTTLTSPDPEKWRHNAAELESMLPIVRDVATRARMIFGSPPTTRAVRPSQPAALEKAPAAAGGSESLRPADFRSVHTQTFAELLDKLGATLVVTTYQSGRVILVRSDRGELNTHLRSFPNPMGIAVAPGRLALGTQREILEFFDMPALSKQLDPPGKHDAVYVPRARAVTGDVRVHDVAYANGQLVFVNTRFSAVCSLDGQHSFVPVWRPPFVTELAPEDRCHLNGLCIVDDRVRYVSVLGRTNQAGGWRANKAAGGCILEVPSGRVIAEGLSMPHSPRWYGGRLWVLESGKGEFGAIDPTTGRVQTLAKLAGFTRGLAFAGPFAFVGLSQVRETNTFSGLPLTETVEERKCGVWVIDTRNGQTVAFLRFEGTVQEIFDIQILNGARFAELLEPTATLLDSTYAIPPAALAAVPAHLKSSTL